MKKLMIAAAAAAMIGGAFATCQEDTPCVYAYKLTLSGKTTVAFTVKGKASTCTEDVCYRKAGSFKIDGYIFGQSDDLTNPDECIEGCSCVDLSAIDDSIFWNTKSKKEVVVDTFEFTQLNLIGKDGKQLEAVGTFNGLTLAGFGTYDVKKLAIKSISGNFAGTLDAPLCETCNYNASSCEDECEETETIVFDLCTLAENSADKTAAFGKWTLKPNSAAAKKLTKEFDGLVLAPKGFIAEGN